MGLLAAGVASLRAQNGSKSSDKNGLSCVEHAGASIHEAYPVSASASASRNAM